MGYVLVYNDTSRIPITITEALNSRWEWSDENFSFDVLYQNYELIYSLIEGFFVENKYIPKKCNISQPNSLTLDDLLLSDFDYIVLGDKTSYVSRIYKGRVPNSISNVIQFKIRGKKSRISIEDDMLHATYDFDEHTVISSAYDFRGTITKSWKKRWSTEDFADLVMNSEPFCYISCINELHIVNNRQYIQLMIIPTFSGINTCVYIRYLYGTVNMKITKCSCPIEYNMVCHFVNYLLDVYHEIEQPIIVENDKLLPILRAYDPVLFVSNYSRESAILPIPGTDQINRIEYPLGSGKFYGAPEGFFPGLKLNRLENANIYPFIVTCYRNDHMKRINSITYNYYHNGIISNQSLKKIISLKRCLSSRYTKVNKRVNKSIVLQEFFNRKVDLGVAQESLLYRYYEELYGLNIVIVNKKKELVIPDCPKPYFWDMIDKKETIIVQESLIKGSYSYSILNEDTKTYVERKLSITTRSNHCNISCDLQHVDFNGKRRIVKIGENIVESVGRPLNVPDIIFENDYIKKSKELVTTFYNLIGINYKENEGSKRHYLFFSADG